MVVVRYIDLEVTNTSKCKYETVKKWQFVCFYRLGWVRESTWGS